MRQEANHVVKIAQDLSFLESDENAIIVEIIIWSCFGFCFSSGRFVEIVY